MNVLHCSLRTRELAPTLVLAARSAGVTAREPYWFLAWTNLFTAAMTLLEYRYARELTIGRIVEAVTETGDDGRREIEIVAEEMLPNPAAWAAVCAAYASGRSAAAIEREIHRAVNDIRSFYRAQEDHVATVETFIINAFGEFRDDRCRPFSPPPRDWSDPALSALNLYDSIHSFNVSINGPLCS